MVAGHSHIQHTKRFVSKKGNALTEINVGSLCGYPGPICEITVQPDQTLFYEVRHLASFRLGGEEIDAQRFFKRHATAMIRRVWESPDRREFTDRLTALQLRGENRPFLWGYPPCFAVYSHGGSWPVLPPAKKAWAGARHPKRMGAGI